VGIVGFKIIAAALVIVAGVIGGVVPLRVGLSNAGKKFLSMGNAFAGGIFIGAGIIHMLGDSAEKFRSLVGGDGYPYSLLICGLGFFGLLFIENVWIKNREIQALSEVRVIYPFILLLVLSIHSIIAGLSLGLEKELISFLVIFVAIIAHKSAAAFSLGISLKQLTLSTGKLVAIILFFSFMTPLGIVLGTIFSQTASTLAATQAEAIFDGIAAGTFIYVGILDIIEEVFEDNDAPGVKWALMSSAFGLMAVVAIWT